MVLLQIISQGLFKTVIFLSFFLVVVIISQSSKHRGKKFVPIKKKVTILAHQRDELDKLLARALGLWIATIVLGLFFQVKSSTNLFIVTGVLCVVISVIINRSAHIHNQYIFVCETAENMQIVNTGAYAYIRHPFYSAELIKLIGFTLCYRSLVSLPALLFIALYLFLLTWLEEIELKQDVCEYKEYKKKVKSKFIPYIY